MGQKCKIVWSKTPYEFQKRGKSAHPVKNVTSACHFRAKVQKFLCNCHEGAKVIM